MKARLSAYAKRTVTASQSFGEAVSESHRVVESVLADSDTGTGIGTTLR